MKYICNEIIVVEGKGDVSYLSSFIDAEFVSTNGYDIKDDVVEYLNAASKRKNIIVLTDSDEAGDKIRENLNKKLLKHIDIKISLSCCNKHNKHGVAECEKSEVVHKLKDFFSNEKKVNSTDLDATNLKLIINKNSKEKLIKSFKTGVCNTKTLIKRLQTLGISQNEIENVLGE